MLRVVSMVVLAACAAGGQTVSDEVLFDFAEGLPPSARLQHGVETAVSRTKQGANLQFRGPASDHWPGIVLSPPGIPWDFSKHARLAIGVRNVGKHSVRIGLRFDGKSDTGDVCWQYTVKDVCPGESQTVEIMIGSTHACDVDGTPIELPGMWAGPWGNLPRGPVSPLPNPREITRILIYAGRPLAPFSFEITNVRLLAASAWNPPDGSSFFPFVDEFGQYIHQQWPGKTRSIADLVSSLEVERNDIKSHPRPESFNMYGGWENGPTLKATGAFRTHKLDGKWWLVDPAGKLFFSYGITSMRLDAKKTPVTPDRLRWFRWIPQEKDPQFRPFLGPCQAWSGAYKHRKMVGFSFGQANMLRRYGDDWQAQARQMGHARLHSWGMNTIGNWSDIGMCTMRKTPYTVGFYIPTANYVGDGGDHSRRFPDVYAPAWEDALRRVLKRWYGETLNDPWCIGYFVDNELEFENDVIPKGTLEALPAQPAKHAFVRLLTEKYGTVDKLNTAWGTQHTSWNALLASQQAPETARARPDFDAFLEQVSDRYFSTIRRVLGEMAPGRLYLGSRFNTFNRIPAAAAARHCDVVSYNLYRYPADLADFTFPGKTDIPMIIGEWHFGARDRGVFFPGLREARDQNERARLFVDYMRAALAHPQFVGAHWFRYRSEPCTGRDLDGENGQLGFVDICDSPYHETVAAARNVAKHMYPFRHRGEWP